MQYVQNIIYLLFVGNASGSLRRRSEENVAGATDVWTTLRYDPGGKRTDGLRSGCEICSPESMSCDTGVIHEWNLCHPDLVENHLNIITRDEVGYTDQHVVGFGLFVQSGDNKKILIPPYFEKEY